jgi:hypothetical protein
VTGVRIIVASWACDALFAVTAIPAAAGADAFDTAATATALALFFASLVVWGWAFAIAVARSARGDDIVVANLFGSVGGAPRDVRFHLFGALGACLLVTIGTAGAEPFGVLVPMLPLGFVGLWAARHGTFPRRASSGAAGR